MVILTTKEYNEAINKVKQIEEFIRKEIMPDIKGTYVIPFGTEKTRGGNSHLNLYVGENRLVVYSGHLEVCFDKDEVPEEIGRGVCIYNSWNYGGDVCYELIREWKRIKAELNSFLTKQITDKKEVKTILNSFEL